MWFGGWDVDHRAGPNLDACRVGGEGTATGQHHIEPVTGFADLEQRLAELLQRKLQEQS